MDAQINYMWEEYEPDLLRRPGSCSRKDLARTAGGTETDRGAARMHIRKLGDVNVNAIEDYKEAAGALRLS